VLAQSVGEPMLVSCGRDIRTDSGKDKDRHNTHTAGYVDISCKIFLDISKLVTLLLVP